MREVLPSGGQRGDHGPERRRITVSVILDAEELAQLDKAAQRLERSRGDLIREAIRKVWLSRRRHESPD
jgi:metal-responsive CopG/Arc/MetJ family transcriptional regulator